MNETNCCMRKPWGVLVVLFLPAGHTPPHTHTTDTHRHTCTPSPALTAHAERHTHCVGLPSSWSRPTTCLFGNWRSFGSSWAASISVPASPFLLPQPTSKYGTLHPKCLLYLLGKRPGQSLGEIQGLFREAPGRDAKTAAASRARVPGVRGGGGRASGTCWGCGGLSAMGPGSINPAGVRTCWGVCERARWGC